MQRWNIARVAQKAPTDFLRAATAHSLFEKQRSYYGVTFHAHRFPSSRNLIHRKSVQDRRTSAVLLTSDSQSGISDRKSTLLDHDVCRKRNVLAQSASRPGALRMHPPSEEEHASDSTPSTNGSAPAESSAESSSGIGTQSVALVGMVLAIATANRVLYKMALVPLAPNYIFFLAQLQTFTYVLVYFSTLYYRRRAGIVSQDMLDAVNKRIFIFIGACEALSSLLGFIGASRLPGVVLPLLAQSSLIWQIGFASTILGKKLAKVQVLGGLLTIIGVCIAAWPSGNGNSVFSDVQPVFAAMYVGSMCFPALANILKEKVFTETREKLGGKQLDIFVVNSFGSAAQAFFVLLLLPVLTSLRNIPFTQLPSYIAQGCKCIFGQSPNCGQDCAGAPALPLIYVACNLALNISALALLRRCGNVVQSLVFSSVVPLTILAFTFPWPYLEAAPPLGWNFLVGAAVLVGGLFTYNSQQWLPALKKRFA
eukprot:jgi/Botrbrau1/14845/Bobra.0278s0015.1